MFQAAERPSFVYEKTSNATNKQHNLTLFMTYWKYNPFVARCTLAAFLYCKTKKSQIICNLASKKYKPQLISNKKVTRLVTHAKYNMRENSCNCATLSIVFSCENVFPHVQGEILRGVFGCSELSISFSAR